MKHDGHFVSKKHRIERDSDNDTHDHDHDHHDDDHDHQENEVEPKQDDNHDDHDDHDHGSTKKKTWTTAQKWGYATLANTFLGKNHIIFTYLVLFISYKLYDINHILWTFDMTHIIWPI